MTEEQAKALVGKLTFEEKLLLLDLLEELEQDRQKKNRPGAANTDAV